MSELAIEVREISKAYRLGVIGRQTLQDEVRYWWHKFRGRNPLEHMGKIGTADRREHATDKERPGRFWALRNVSFSVQPGEVLGIIGRNGAGKSTLLKILSRITEPTEGEAVINGKVGSLLEVGTGFHPELTGGENIYMNGTILGMKKREIDRKFDEIVAFAEIEQFLNTPVKRYSSGMHVRLAFAVAAHLDPEILLIDEVLAVGDAGFQKKCLGKMSEVAREGRTVLFVSHNMNAIKRLTSRCILIEHGKLTHIGEPESVIEHYLDATLSVRGAKVELTDEHRRGVRKDIAREVLLKSVTLSNPETGEVKERFVETEALNIELELESFASVNGIEIVLQIIRNDGVAVCSMMTGVIDRKLEKGRYNISCRLSNPQLAKGEYHIRAYITTGARKAQDFIPDAIGFAISLDPRREYDVREIGGVYPDIIRMPKEWTELQSYVDQSEC